MKEAVKSRNLRTIPFVIILFLLSFPAQAQQWERVWGGENPGVRISDEHPVCWFSSGGNSPQYSIRYQTQSSVTVIVSNRKYDSRGCVIEYSETITGNGALLPFTVSFSDITYNALGQVIKYYASVTGNDYSLETYVYDAAYNSHGQATGFKELRHYQTSGNTYYIEISGVSYNGFGQVMNGYPVNITKNSAIEQPALDSGCSPSGSWSGSMGIGGTVSTCINDTDGRSEMCWSIPYSYYGMIFTASSCTDGTYTYTSSNNYQATYSGIATENTFGTSSNYTLTINGWLDSCDSASGYYVIHSDALGWPSSYSGLWFLHRIDLSQKATMPYPADEAIDQSTSVMLSWFGGGAETSFDVYFGTDPDLDESDFIGNQIETTYDPGILSFGTTYYWRIDVKNDQGTTTGDLWSFTTTEIIQTGDISDYISGIYMEQIWDYGDPTDRDDLMYEFYLEIYAYDETASNMDANVASIEFVTPAGNTFQIPKQPGEWSDGIWRSYDYGEYEYITDFWFTDATWKYRARLTDLADFKAYGDGEYTIILYYNNGSSSQTTAWFGIPDTNDPIAQPTQEPILTSPLHHQTLESPVTFTWEPCTDTNVEYIYIDVDELGTIWLGDKWKDFDVSETSWGPVYMPDGVWEAEIVFDQWISSIPNDDGIWINAAKYSKSRYRFTVQGCPWTSYEVWGGDTWIDWSDGSYGNIADLEANGYIKLGESDGQTATFSGQYQYYLIATTGQFLIDSIQGSDGFFYSSFEDNCERSNISNEDYILGPQDGQCAMVGVSNPWDDYSGFFAFTNPGSWEGLTVMTSDLNLNIKKEIKNSAEDLENVGPNDTITYRICFDSNDLTEEVTDVTVVDILPENVSFISADSDEVPGEYDPDIHTYTWRHPGLAPNSVVVRDLTVQINPNVALGTTITNLVTINSNETPPTTANMSIVTSRAPSVTGELELVPDRIRRNGAQVNFKAVLQLPPDHMPDRDAPVILTILSPEDIEAAIEAKSSHAVETSDGVIFNAWFGVDELMRAIPDYYGVVRVRVTGTLVSGQTFSREAIMTITRFAGN